MTYSLKSQNCVLSILFLILLCSELEARVRYKVRTKPECRDKGPRRFEELPQVVISGFVEQTYPSDGDDTYTGSVLVKRVFKGPYGLENTHVTIGGLGMTGVCHSSVRKRDTWIFLLNQVSHGFLRLNQTLLKLTLPNLDRMNALVKDEPYRRREAIIDLPCEIKYCLNNGDCVEEDRSGGGILTRAKCQCLRACDHMPNAVCGSNGETFQNECQLRLLSCQRGSNYFVRFANACETGRRTRDVQVAFLSQITM